MLISLSTAAVPTLADDVIERIEYSFDLHHLLQPLELADEEVISDDVLSPSGILGLVSLGAPTPSDVDAYVRLPDGVLLFSTKTTVDLDGLIAEPADLVRLENEIYSLELDASALGVPATANLDAALFDGDNLSVSFDTTVALPTGAGTVLVEDEDLVTSNGTTFEPTLLFDGTVAGVPASLDLDGAFLDEANGDLLVSFDLSGALGAVDFDDEDVLRFSSPSAWALEVDVSQRHTEVGSGADVDALSAFVADLIFADGFESGDTGAWDP